MKWKLTIFLLFFFLQGYSQHGWDRIYNFTQNPDYFFSSVFDCYTDSTCFFISGTTSPNLLTPLENIYLSCLNYSGDLLWQKMLFSPGFNAMSGNYCLTKMGDNKYVVAATQVDITVNKRVAVLEPFFYFFNANGDSLGFVKYTDSIITRDFNSFVIDDNKAIIAAGQITDTHLVYDPYTKLYNYDSNAIWLSKYDSSGNRLWQKSFLWTSGGDAFVNKIVISTDWQHYLIAGYVYDGANYQTFFLKTDTAGNEIWHKFLPRPFPIFDFNQVDIIPISSGGYYFVSNYSTKIPLPHWTPVHNIYYGRLDENGDTVWTKGYADTTVGDCIGTNIAYSKDGNLLMRGANPYGNFAPMLFKTDTMGNVLWFREQQRIHYWIPTQTLYTLNVIPDGRILSGGVIESPQNDSLPGYFDTVGSIAWMILADTNGMHAPGDTFIYRVSVPNTAVPAAALKIYPNPATKYIIIENATGCQYVVTDTKGSVILQGRLTDGKQRIDIPEMPPGMYLLQLISKEGEKRSFKFIKE